MANMIPLAALLVVCIMSVATGQLTSDGCYREYTNSKVNCMTSFLSQTVNSLEDCGALCTKNAPKCKAAQMSPFPDTTCQLFDTALNVTASTGRRRRLAGCYGYGPSIMPGQGYCYLLPTGYGCSGQPVTGQTPPTPPTAPPQTVPTDTTPTTTIPIQTDAPTVPTVATVPSVPTDPSTISTIQATSPSISDPQLPPEVTCPADKSVRYTFVEGYKLNAPADYTFQAPTEKDCMTACTNNRTPDGKQTPCRSADYNAKSQQCSVNSQITPPIGNTTATADADSKHFEKVCVTTSIAQSCPGAYFRSPQHILVGFAQAVTTATSTVDCLEQCANSQTRFNFTCGSGMYYFDESTNNCILNSETRATDPSLFVPETTDGVEYFESGCPPNRLRRQASPSPVGPAGPAKKKRNRNILHLNTDSFSAWTMCDSVTHSHMRFRQCTSLNPNRCQIDLNECDPKKEADYDLDVNAKSAAGKLQQSKKSPARSIKKFDAPPTFKGTTPKPAPTTTPHSVPPGECVPLIRDGRLDCNNGLRLLPNGKKQPCVPSRNCDKRG